MENQEVAPEQISSNNIGPNYQFLSKIFIEILMAKNESFKNAFQAAAPDVYADIESFYGNKNCSCRGKVEKHIVSNKEKSAEFLNAFIAENGGDNHTLFKLEDIEKKYTPVPRPAREPQAHQSPPIPQTPEQIVEQILSQSGKNDDDYSGRTEVVKISEWENYIIGLREKQVKFFQFSTVKVDDETIRVFFL
jgi:hypothetical protein